MPSSRDENGAKLTIGIVALLASIPMVRDGLRHTGSGSVGEGLTVWRGDSPLDYHGSRVKRIALIDPSAPPSHPRTTYYVPTKNRRGSVPGAEPGTVGFIDHHVARGYDGKVVVIDYVSVREDQRGQGLMVRLVDELFSEHEDAAEIDFGRIMSNAVERQYHRRRDDERQGGPRVRGKLW